MKRFFVILLGILMAVGAGSAAMAAPALTFDIDFYGGDTSYVQGTYDTGSTIDLLVGQSVNVDILFSLTEEGVVGGGFTIPLDPLRLKASNLTFPSPFMNTGLSGIAPDKIDYEAWAVPPGTVVGPGSDIALASFTLQCVGLGSDDLFLNDLNGNAQWVTALPNGTVLDNQLGGYLATVHNSAVPIPGALWLLASGLMGLAGLRRKMSS